MTARDLDVLTAGEILVDFVAPQAADLTVADEFLRTGGGAPAIVAAAVARLGGRSAFAGAVGADPFGEFLRRVLEAHGVLLHALRTVPERTSLAFVARNRGGIPDFVFYRDADFVIRPEDLPPDLVRQATFLHLSSLALMQEPSRSATLTAAREAHGVGTLVSVDPNLRPSSWPSTDMMLARTRDLLEEASLLKVNEHEAHLLTGEADPHRALDLLAGPQRLVLMTLGEEGCLWHWHGESGSVQSAHVEVADTTGAGDAFIGAVLAELSRRGYDAETLSRMSRDELVASLRFAAAAAAFSCTRTGAMSSLPTREEVLGVLGE